MTNRVLIQGGATNVLACSLPGFDVTTANLDQMCFDSRWSGLTFFAQGTIDAQGTASSEGVVNASFGTTLSEFPILLCYVRQISGIGGSPINSVAWTPTVFRGNSEDYWWAAEVTTTFISFRSFAFAAALRLYYTVLRRPAG